MIWLNLRFGDLAGMYSNRTDHCLHVNNFEIVAELSESTLGIDQGFLQCTSSIFSDQYEQYGQKQSL